MRIAVFYNLPFSGAKRTVFEHVRGLKSRGHVVDVYTLEEERDFLDPGRIANNEYRYTYNPLIFNVPLLRHPSQDLSDFYILKRVHKKIAEDIDVRRYDSVLIHTDRLTQAPFILRFLKTQNVYFCLEPLKMAYEYGLRNTENLSFLNRTYENYNRQIRKIIDRDNARAADSTLAISYFDRELMIQAFDLYPKISYLGVDIKQFTKRNIAKKNQVLFIGQKLTMNGYEFAKEAIQLIPSNKRPVLKVLSISKESNGRLSDRQIAQLYNESLITLSLSNLDTFGLVALESLACEVPVVAFNTAGYRETMINGKTGYLVDFDAKEIAEKITYLIDNPAINKKMGHWGRVWVEKNWTWEKQIAELEQCLRHIQ